MKLGVYDQEIIRLLGENARMPLSNIGKCLRKSSNFVKYRIGLLKKDGILAPPSVNVHFPALGFKEFIVYLEVRSHEKKQSSIFHTLVEHPFSVWVGTGIGKYNYRVKFVAKNEEHIYKIIDSLHTLFHNCLRSYEFVEVIEYILGMNRVIAGTKVVHPSSKHVFSRSLNSSEVATLRAVMENPEISLLELSQKIKMTPQGARLKLKHLESFGIRGYTFSVHTSNLERLHCICRINFRDITTLRPKLASFIDSHRVIGRSFFTCGSTNVEITLFPRSLKELRDVINLINDTFSDHIISFDNFIVLEKTMTAPIGIFDTEFLKE